MDRSSVDERRSSVDVVMAALYMDILEGVYRPGSFIRLNDVAKNLGVSMMPVREAIRELATLGVVEAIPNRGAQVRELSLEDLVETYRGRLYLEGLALGLGAKNFTPEREALARKADKKRSAAVEEGDAFSIVMAHERFHFVLYESCENRWITKALLPGWRNAARYRGTSLLRTHAKDFHNAQHAELIEAMSSHDVNRAITILHRHLTTAAEAVALDIAGTSVIERLPRLDEVLTQSGA